jgi:hypothetical protein
MCANGSPVDPSAEETFWDAAGALAWGLYCS